MFEFEISIMPWRVTYLYVSIIFESRNQGDKDKERHLDCFSQRSMLSLAQDKVTQVKIMLMPSRLNQDKEQLKEESSWQAQAYSFCIFIYLLSIGCRTIKRNATW
jgi:hypothetical protein